MQFLCRPESPERNRSRKGTIKGFLQLRKARPPTMLIANSFHYYSSPFIPLHVKWVYWKHELTVQGRGILRRTTCSAGCPTPPCQSNVVQTHHPRAPPGQWLTSTLPHPRHSPDLPHPAAQPCVVSPASPTTQSPFLAPRIPTCATPNPAVLQPKACSSVCHHDIWSFGS